MNEKPLFLALIPARGGSKRIPRKNLATLAGKPLLCWSVEAARKSRFIDRTVVSTDDSEIAETAKKCGADVPFMRPEGLAGDTTATVDVIEHAIRQLASRGESYDFLVLLQPTSPLRKPEHIDEAITLLLDKKADAVIAVSPVEHPPMWANMLPEDGDMKDFLKKEVVGLRSQDLPVYYRINGAIYIVKIERFLKEGTLFFETGTYAYRMPREFSIDIDEPIDLVFAEALLRYQASVRLTPADADFFDDFYTMRCEKENLFWTGHADPPRYDSLKKWYHEQLEHNPTRRIFAIRQGGRNCGYLYIDTLDDETVEISYGVSSRFQNRGIATAAITEALKEVRKIWPKARVVTALVAEGNTASSKVLQKAGFEKGDTVSAHHYPLQERSWRLVRWRKRLQTEISR